MAFTTNITGFPTTGSYGTDGKPSGINNDGGIEVTPQNAGNVPSSSTESREGINNDKSISGNPYNQSASSTDTPSPVGNPSIGNYTESLSERIVDKGSWNPLTAEYSTPPFSASSGCWNVGNNSEASPYVNTLKVDNAIRDDNISTIGGGGGPQPFVPGRKAPVCDCPPFIALPDIQWGLDEVYIEPGDACQSPRDDELRDMRIPYFSGDHEGHSGVFALITRPWDMSNAFMNDLNQDTDFFGTPCFPPEALRTAINGGHYPGPNCTWKHVEVSYRGTGISDVGVSGANWTGWCNKDYAFNFYESRIGGHCSGKPGHLYACDGDGFISELTPTYIFTMQDSCDCKARYDNGRWSSKSVLPTLGSVWVQDAKPDWDASNDGAMTEEVATKVYWTGSGCYVSPLWFNRHDQHQQTGLDKTKIFAIVATGGGGPGAGDNIPPYWSDTECDWMYAIREVVSGECNNLEYSPFHDPTTTGCPTGPIIKIGLTKLNDCDSYGRCPGVNWVCCLSGTGEDPGSSGYCNSIFNRGPKHLNGDYVCYLDGTGNVPGSSGQNWMVNSDSHWSGNTGVACEWTYDLQYYTESLTPPSFVGPSGALQTGILESAISTGCV